MNIFITGVAGVLGTTLKNELRKHGHAVSGCDLTHSEDPQIVRADVSERRQLHEVMDEFGPFDLVYWLAAEFGRLNGDDYYEQLFKTNFIGTQNGIEECVDRRVKMVFASSSEAYGLSEAYSKGDALEEGMLDRHPPQFHSLYAMSKYANERQICMAARNQDLDAVVLRFFNVYGPPERYTPYRSVVCQFIYQLLSGEPITVNRGGFRSHLWIGDWVDTVAGIAREKTLDALAFNKFWPGSGGTPYVPVFNIGGTEYESVDGLYNRLIKILGSSIPEPDVTFIDKEEANSATKKPDCSMAELWLDHKPQKSLDDGLKETIIWMRRQYGL